MLDLGAEFHRSFAAFVPFALNDSKTVAQPLVLGMQLCIQLNAVLMGTGHSHTLRFPPLDLGAEFDIVVDKFVNAQPKFCQLFSRSLARHIHLLSLPGE